MTLLPLRSQAQSTLEPLVARTTPATPLRRAQAVRWWITEAWVQEPPHAFLPLLSSHGRGWHIVLCEAPRSPPTAEESCARARALGRDVRVWPIATPELTAMAQIWRQVQGRALANRTTPSLDASADRACRDVLARSRRERLRKAGVLSGNVWLTT